MEEKERVVQKTARWKAVGYNPHLGFTVQCNCGYRINRHENFPGACSKCEAKMENSRYNPDNWVQARDSYFARKKSQEAQEAEIISRINKT